MIFGSELLPKVLDGSKTMTRRPVESGGIACRYAPGRDYAVQPGRGKKAVARIKVTEVRRERWRDITEADAGREGFGRFAPAQSAFLSYVRDLYGPGFDFDAECWVISFELREDE